MEGKQVIESSRIFAGALGAASCAAIIVISLSHRFLQGPTNQKLCLTYQNLQNGHGMINELAALVCDICENVPKGILCFVSSYRFLDQLKGAIESKKEIKKRLHAIKVR